MMSLPDNIDYFENTDINAIADHLAALKADGIHATNGTYAKPVAELSGTTLAGFQFVADYHASLKDIFLIAVNSNKSMQNFSKGQKIEAQRTRALKAALPTAWQNAGRTVAVVFYDEKTPEALYNKLAATPDVTLKTLHKWGGYGVGDGPVIEGAECFEKVLAFPFFDQNQKPWCFDETRTGSQTSNTEVISLYHTKGKHGATYLKQDSNNTPLFPVRRPV